MKTYIKNLFLLPALIASLSSWAAAQTFTTLYNFAVGGYQETPSVGLILSGYALYGTAAYFNGGPNTVFKLNTDGTGFTNLHNFTGSDGPSVGLVTAGNTLYGTTAYGGSFNGGTVFAVKTDGTGFANLHTFAYVGNGVAPSLSAGLILSGSNILYGTTEYGGPSAYGGFVGNGTVFAVKTDGTGFTNLHNFTLGTGGYYPSNSDGANPQAGLILSGNTLYGTAAYGGSSGNGAVFAVNTNGTGFTTLYNFTGGSDGSGPACGLILSGYTLYGTTAGFWGYPTNLTIFSLSFVPQLTILRSGGPPSGIILTWPTNNAGFDYTGYTLQSAPAISGTFTNLPAATSPYTNPISGTQQFFRLSQ